MHVLSLVQFVAIYALLGGPIRQQICGRGTAIDFKGWGLSLNSYLSPFVLAILDSYDQK